MFKKYNPRLVRSYRSYKLSDLCRLYRDKKLHAQTIRGWINAGKLEAFKDGKTILVYGAVLKAFLQESNKQHKRVLAFKQFRCSKCKTIANPVDNLITKLTPGKNSCILAFGICPKCSHEMHRIYKGNMEAKILESFSVQLNVLEALCNHSCSPSKTHQKTAPKTVLCEPSNKTPQQEKEDTTPLMDNTHINPTQLTLF